MRSLAVRLRRWTTLATASVAALLLVGTVVVGSLPDDLPPIIPRPTVVPTATPLPATDLRVGERDVVLSLPLSEGEPFTATVTVHNVGELPADRVLVLFNIVRPAPQGDQNIIVGRATGGPVAPHATTAIAVVIPPVVPLLPGIYRYQASASVINGPPDRDLRNNFAPAGVLALREPQGRCAGPPDLGLTSQDLAVDGTLLRITLHNYGPATVYDVALVVHSVDAAAGDNRVYHVPRLLPCDGTATLSVFRGSTPLEIDVNPQGVGPPVPEVDRRNNQVSWPVKSQDRSPSRP